MHSIRVVAGSCEMGVLEYQLHPRVMCDGIDIVMLADRALSVK
jgi:hypothetical protein